MSTLTMANMQAEVLLTLNNEQTDHPLISAGLHVRAINEAVNRLIRMVGNADLFPEKHVRLATAAATSVSANTISIPSTATPLAIVTKVTCTESSSAPTLAATTEKPLGESDMETIGLLNKATTTTGYPKLWARYGESILYHPTTQTGYTTYLVVYGIAEEAALVSGAATTFGLNARWDQAIVFLAAADVAMKMGYADRAVELDDWAKRRIADSVNIMARQRNSRRFSLRAAWAPRG